MGTTDDMNDFSLVLPLYNEGPSLLAHLEQIYTTLSQSHLHFEIILIDDASKDASASIAGQFARTHDHVSFSPHEHNKGRGATVMDGCRLANGAVIGFMDVDCEVSPIYLPDFVRLIHNNTHDVVTGLRIYAFSFRGSLRSLLSVGYRWLERRMLGIWLKDTEAGYKVFRRSAVEHLLPLCTHPGWFWDTEIMAYCVRAGLRIYEYPVLFLRDPKKVSTVRIIRDSLNYFFSIIRFRKTIRAKKGELR